MYIYLLTIYQPFHYTASTSEVSLEPYMSLILQKSSINHLALGLQNQNQLSLIDNFRQEKYFQVLDHGGKCSFDGNRLDHLKAI